MLEDAILLTSELCTNAIEHTASGSGGGSFDVTVYSDSSYLRIEVRDDGAAPVPAAHSSALLAEDGRGLEIVGLTAHRWGVRGDSNGRCVFFELRWNDSVGPKDRERIAGCHRFGVLIRRLRARRATGRRR